MGRTRGKFTNKVIYLENSGLQPIGGQYLQNVGGQLYWNGVNIGTTTINATDVQYTPVSPLTATNVKGALDEIVGLINDIVEEGTTASNGLTKTLLDVKLGGDLTGVTIIDLNGANSLEITSTDGLTKIRIIDGTVEFQSSTDMILKAPSVTSTSVNKSVQLANITGALSLVNKGMYAKRTSKYAPGAYSISVAGADGLTTSASNTTSIVTTGTIEQTISSRVNNSGVNDFAVFVNLMAPLATLLSGQKMSLKYSITIKPSAGIVALPVLYHGFGGWSTGDNIAGSGLPVLIPGYGYREGVYCRADEITVIQSDVLLDYNNSFLENMASLAVYRCVNTLDANDASAVNIGILGWSFEFKQI